MPTVREAWLKLTTEPVIDPDLCICDPHHHLWYQTENLYELEDLCQDIAGGHRIVQTVFVESRKMLKKTVPPAMQPVGETEFVREVAFRAASQSTIKVASGIVGFADLTLGAAVEPVLESHIEAGQGRFCGVRYTSTWNASPEIKSSSGQGILADSNFRKGFACLKKYGLSFDAWLYHPQLMELVDLARTYPDIPIILDHIGGPLGIGPYKNRRQEEFLEWKRNIGILSTCENVIAKLGGLGMELCGFGWDKLAAPPGSSDLMKAFSPYFIECIERFGVDRCMFESNFPVDKRSYSYTILWNAFKRITKDFSISERHALFYDTAIRVYRLPKKV
jgi:predicted TIM-barrel fold metal-dependent hydrolase